MNRFFSLLLLLCLLLSLTACGEAPAPAPDAAPAQEAEPPAPSDAPSETTADEARRSAFAEVLRTAHDQQVLPDGGQLDGTSIESIEGNLFTVRDVDGDGQEELILLWQNAIVAGQMEIVYGYDEAAGEVYEKLHDFPGIIFYDNGTAEGPWSHNQGWAGEFWPYNLHRCNPETGVYESMGSVDAWDKSLVSNGFPNSVDADGDGMVYTLLTDNWDFTYHRDVDSGVDYWYYEQPPVDGVEYLAWRDGIVGDADFLELSFLPLTAENVADALDVPYEPLLTTLLPNPAG